VFQFNTLVNRTEQKILHQDLKETFMTQASQIEIKPTTAVTGSIQPPGSKSITNRAFICAALADGTTKLIGALDSEDTRMMFQALCDLGIQVEADWDHSEITVHGLAGKIPAEQADLFLANSGTSIRFLTALASLGKGRYRLDGIERMRERPIKDLIEVLNKLGSNVSGELTSDCPPVVVQANELPGGTAEIRGDISSQYLSAIMMAAPYAQNPVHLKLSSILVSQPYIQMTIDVMNAFGGSLEVETDQNKQPLSYLIPKQIYRACDYIIEPDASAASYFFALAAITGGEITVKNLSNDSMQGDIRFVDLLEKMGCEVTFTENSTTVKGGKLTGGEFDMNAISDTVMTLAVVALFAEGPTKITNVGHIRHKETDRIEAVAIELRKLGAQVEETEDSLTITPAKYHAAEIDTYNDHRMAMSFALAGLRIPGVKINDPKCTEKTYPLFFEDLDRLTKDFQLS
jgi:3-phosphoshikimate 1-carboxyvinyltransferase